MQKQQEAFLRKEVEGGGALSDMQVGNLGAQHL